MFGKNYYKQYLLSNNTFRRFARETLGFSPRVKAIFNILKALGDNARVLDVGCGTGGFLELIEKHAPQLSTFGIDIGLPPELKSSAHFLRGSASALPFAADVFDVVVCNHVIEHMTDPYPAVAEMRRVCRPGGYVYIEAPSPRSTQSILWGNFWDDPTHVRPYSPEALERMVSEQGIVSFKKGYKRSLVGVTLGLPYAVLGKILGDQQATSFFPAYAFGFFSYIIGRKAPES